MPFVIHSVGNVNVIKDISVHNVKIGVLMACTGKIAQNNVAVKMAVNVTIFLVDVCVLQGGQVLCKVLINLNY
jgi:hypothetical protein